MSTPTRVQLSRARGWRKPENTVVVARPTKWGNPYTVEQWGQGWAVTGFQAALEEGRLARITIDDVRAELAGKNLACWCPLDQPCGRKTTKTDVWQRVTCQDCRAAFRADKEAKR